MDTLEQAKEKAEKAKVLDVVEHLEGMVEHANTYDQPWLERAAKLLRRWGIDL